MYENATYAELKSLPKEQKPEAWKELKNLYKTQKELAEKLGVSPAIVYNMISRYAGDEKKSAKLELVKPAKKTKVKKQAVKTVQYAAAQETKPIVPEVNDVEVIKEPKKTRTRVKKQAEKIEQVIAVPETLSAVPEVKDESFSISIKKTVSGEDAQVLLNGVGSTFLKGQQYSIEVKITEK